MNIIITIIVIIMWARRRNNITLKFYCCQRVRVLWTIEVHGNLFRTVVIICIYFLFSFVIIIIAS